MQLSGNAKLLAPSGIINVHNKSFESQQPCNH